MAKTADAASLFKYSIGWDKSDRPAPYDTWANLENPDYSSCYNNTAAKKPTKLISFCIKALLSVIDKKNSEIGICKVTNKSYASQWAQPNGDVILASVMSNGKITACIRKTNGRHEATPRLGNSNTVFDPSSILALYICYEADMAKEKGTVGTITWDQIDYCRKEWENTGVMDEKTVYLVNDALYYGLSYGGIACDLRNGNINLFTARHIEMEEYAGCEVISGNPDILVPHSGTAVAGGKDYTVSTARAEFADYIASRTWTPEEEAMIPSFPDDKPVPPEVMTFAQRFVKSRSFKNPLNNFCWRGGTGFGKSTGAEILASILHTPFVRITCSEETELNEFLSQFVPNPDANGDNLRLHLPSFDDIKNDPVGAYEVLTGKAGQRTLCRERNILHSVYAGNWFLSQGYYEV